MELSQQSSRPSKQFIKRGAIAIGIVAVVLIVQTAWFQRLVFKREKSAVVVSETVGDIVGKDSNGNKIPDWEEKLWGLDPTVLYTNGTSNAEIIAAKKKALGITDSMSTEPTDDTDRLARELFTLTAALGQSDEVDDQTLQAISAKLAASVDIKQVSNTYTLKDIQTVQTSIPTLTSYRTSMRNIIGKYDANTPDIEVLATALQNEDQTGLPQLKASATTYQKLAKELARVKVPVGLAQDHLGIVNSFSGIATSLTYMTEINDNSIAALVGVAVYKKYSLKLNTSLVNMNNYLATYGIL